MLDVSGQMSVKAGLSRPASDTCRHYQLDLTTPGICPCSANSRKQMRQRLNLRK